MLFQDRPRGPKVPKYIHLTLAFLYTYLQRPAIVTYLCWQTYLEAGFNNEVDFAMDTKNQTLLLQ